MTKFRDGFMMKSPLPKHQKEFYDEAERLSKESGTPGDYDRDNPEVRKQLDKAEEAKKSHENDSAAKMTAAQPLSADMYFVAPDQIGLNESDIENAGNIGAKFALKREERTKELDAIQNPNDMGNVMTRGEARKQRRKNKKQGL